MAIKASMTGHLVFSTLHTNSAIGAIPRLVDIGVDAFLLEDTLIGVLAQRLVRRVCSHCGENTALTDDDLRWLGGNPGNPRKGRGCERCDGSGYRGRTAITELFLPDEEIAAAIRVGADQPTLMRLARAAGFRTMAEDGIDKVRAGLTTREEVERVNRSQRLGRDERADARVHGD
jgi:general secretion pathway protein E